MSSPRPSSLEYPASVGQRLWSVDIEARRLPEFNINYGDVAGFNEMAGPRISFQLRYRFEEVAWQDDRVTPLARMGCANDRPAACIHELFDQQVEISGLKLRHVCKDDNRTGNVRWQVCDTRLQGRRQPGYIVGVADNSDALILDRTDNAFRLVTDHGDA